MRSVWYADPTTREWEGGRGRGPSGMPLYIRAAMRRGGGGCKTTLRARSDQGDCICSSPRSSGPSGLVGLMPRHGVCTPTARSRRGHRLAWGLRNGKSESRGFRIRKPNNGPSGSRLRSHSVRLDAAALCAS